jgi:uncharacterized Zn finger protein (UPF0148 family)
MTLGDDILAMKREAEKGEIQERTHCPNDGWLLERASNGTLHCPMGDFTDPPR